MGKIEFPGHVIGHECYAEYPALWQRAMSCDGVSLSGLASGEFYHPYDFCWDYKHNNFLGINGVLWPNS